MKQEKFHITFGNKRTTVTVDIILSELMAIKLGAAPGTREAKIMVREWLQAILPERLGNSTVRQNASQWSRKYLIEEIADSALLSVLDSKYL